MYQWHSSVKDIRVSFPGILKDSVKSQIRLETTYWLQTSTLRDFSEWPMYTDTPRASTQHTVNTFDEHLVDTVSCKMTQRIYLRSFFLLGMTPRSWKTGSWINIYLKEKDRTDGSMTQDESPAQWLPYHWDEALIPHYLSTYFTDTSLVFTANLLPGVLITFCLMEKILPLRITGKSTPLQDPNRFSHGNQASDIDSN